MIVVRKILWFVLFLPATQVTTAAVLPGPVVDAAWLSANLNKVQLLDVRADIKSFNTKPHYLTNKKTGKKELVKFGGHIPGAGLVNYKKLRAEQIVNGKKVTRLAVPKKDFEQLMQSVGLDKGSAVVIVSKGLGNGDVTMATRLYWQLKYFGQDQVAILDGGMAGWLMDLREYATKTSKPASGSWRAVTVRKELLAGSDEVATASKSKSAQLVDTRPLAQYLGVHSKSYVYAKGHIAGAKVFPNELLTGAQAPAKFTSVAELRALARELGIDATVKTITYCNSGHLASGSWFVFSELLGNKHVKLYDGSMHQWTLEQRPVTSLKME